MMNRFDDVQKFGREGMDRTMQSLGAVAHGWQSLAGEAAGSSQQSFEQGAAYLEKLMSAGSLEGAARAQTEFTKSAYGHAVDQGTRFAELYLDLVKNAVKPFEGFVPTAAK